jgi:hypothetical protein
VLPSAQAPGQALPPGISRLKAAAAHSPSSTPAKPTCGWGSHMLVLIGAMQHPSHHPLTAVSHVQGGALHTLRHHAAQTSATTPRQVHLQHATVVDHPRQPLRHTGGGGAFPVSAGPCLQAVMLLLLLLSSPVSRTWNFASPRRMPVEPSSPACPFDSMEAKPFMMASICGNNDKSICCVHTAVAPPSLC